MDGIEVVVYGPCMALGLPLLIIQRRRDAAIL